MSPCRVRSSNPFTITRFVPSIILICVVRIASAQQSHYPILSNADSAEVWFDRIVSPEHAALVNGPAYSISFRGFKTHPFYQSPESDRSFVRYDNDLYRNVDLLYDSYGDILVLKCITASNVYFIKLDQKMVQRFDLHGHHFKKYDEGISAGIGAYFDILFEGTQFDVVVKRRKVERLDGSRSDYQEDDVYYIVNNGEWIRITGKGSFSKTLKKDQRKELSAFININNINVRKRKDEDLRKLGAFCYSLKERK